MKKISYIIFSGTILSSFFGFSQDTLAISKSELVQKVSEKNLQIKIAEKAYQSAKADYNQSNALLFAQHQCISYWNFYNQSIDGFWF
jgi:hypothetical protein